MNKIPQISTRGYYDLNTGKTIRNKGYSIYPKKFFDELGNQKEITIMIHGLRNNRKDAKKKFLLTKNRLKKIGYPYPIIGFSYDSNTKGAHLKKYVKKSLKVGQKIARKNGVNLGKFIHNTKKENPKIRIRLIGHSLGTEVIFSAINYLSSKQDLKNIVESAYFFGSSLPRKNIITKKFLEAKRRILVKNLINYFAPSDEVLAEGVNYGLLDEPLGLMGLASNVSKYKQKKVLPKNHRFASYVQTIKSYP